MMRNQTILHPTDFSEGSQPAFQLACSLASDHGARLVVLHVIPPPTLVDGGDPVAAAIIEEFHNEQREKLAGLRLQDSAVQVEHRLVAGNPPGEILRAACDSGCGMIVTGTHGLTGMRRVLLGSVAESVLRQAPCPVVTVKGAARETAD
jgi:nucleotide-binding universal stress UspA family protein